MRPSIASLLNLTVRLVALLLALALPAAAQPNLTAIKTNNVGGATDLPSGAFTWSITIANAGNADAVFSFGQPSFGDNLPTGNITYGTVTATLSGGATGDPFCSIATDTLVCVGAVTIPAGESFTVSFSATPAAVGSYVNPRAAGVCKADPAGLLAESNEADNDCADTVSVTSGATGPDLTVLKSNDVSGTTELAAGAFAWMLQVANGGDEDATFTSGQSLLSDNLPNSNMSYAAPSVGSQSGISGTGTIGCTVVASSLNCIASAGTVTLGSGASFIVSIDATASAAGVFSNPRPGGSCAVDPNNSITNEDDEGNNSCSDSVTVGASPDLTATKANNVSGQGIVDEAFSWSITVANIGGASFTETTFPFLLDALPNSNMNYGPASVTASSGLTGTLTCSIDGSFNLQCNPSPSATLSAGGSFTVSFSATPTAVGTFNNPRPVSTCRANPAFQVLETLTNNNDCSDSVTVTTGALGPDLTATKNDDVSSLTELAEGSFNWSISVANGGDEPATFAVGQDLLTDNLPDSGLTYGTPAVFGETGISGTGAIQCVVAGSDLTCTASGGTVILAASSGAFTVSLTATPSTAATYDNPRNGGVCSADPGGNITEDNEANNTCADAVVVADSPDLVVVKTNDATLAGAAFTWNIRIDNSGGAEFMLPAGFPFLLDNLPNSNVSYGAPSISSSSGISGTVDCAIDASFNLTCSAVTAASIGSGGHLTVSFSVTPSTGDDLVNPRAGGVCSADPASSDLELDEDNNDCADTVAFELFADGFETGDTTNWS